MSGCNLIPPEFPDSLSWEAHQKMVGRGDYPQSIQYWPSKDCVGGRGAIGYQEIYYPSDLLVSRPSSDWQVDGSEWKQPVTRESNQGHLNGLKFVSSNTYLVEG